MSGGILNAPWTVKLIITPGVQPTTEQLNIGDICLNVADGIFFFRLLDGTITQLISANTLLGLLTKTEADQLYQPIGLLMSKKFQISQEDLTGDFVVIQHDLGTTDLDVTITDESGRIDLNWKPISTQSIEVDFTGLAPIDRPFQILIER